MKKKSFVTKTKEEYLVEYVVEHYSHSRVKMSDLYEKWKSFYNDYRMKYTYGKMPWQANYAIPYLRDVVRTKVPIYMNILFPIGVGSFDVVPSSPDDAEVADIVKSLLVYQLSNVGKGRGGFFSCFEELLKQFEIYGYAVCMVPWKKRSSFLKYDYEGPEIEVVSLFDFFPDPSGVNPIDSWVVVRKRDVTSFHLRSMAKAGIYTNIEALGETTQPFDELGFYPPSPGDKDRVELLEFHGEVPVDLLEGMVADEALLNPFNTDYVRAIITVANRKVCIRAEEYPYDAPIFIDVAKDRLPEEPFGFGTAEDIQAMVEELVNAHNKLTDCINIIANPMFAVNPTRVSGISEHLIACPGRVFRVNTTGSVLESIAPIPTSSQVGTLNPLMVLINVLEEKIMKISQSVPSIAPMATKKGLHETLGGTLLMQGNAIEPIKQIVRHALEPFFERLLTRFYFHDLQFFEKESAFVILGEEKSKEWMEHKNSAEIQKNDIQMVAPKFVTRGVSIFSEKQIEVQSLLQLLQIAGGITMPAADAFGNPIVGPDGNPVMVQAIDVREIIKRLALALNIDDVYSLVPSLQEEKERRKSDKRMGKILEAMRNGGMLGGGV